MKIDVQKSFEIGQLYSTTQPFFFFLIEEINLNRSDKEIWSDFSAVDSSNYSGTFKIYSGILDCDIERLGLEQTILVLRYKKLLLDAKTIFLLKILCDEKVGWIFSNINFLGLEKFNKGQDK